MSHKKIKNPQSRQPPLAETAAQSGDNRRTRAAGLPSLRLLFGLTDRSGRDLGLGIVVSADADTGMLNCLIPVDPARLTVLRRGSITLDDALSDTRGRLVQV